MQCVFPVKCSPFVVLLCGQSPCLHKLVQQQAHVLPSNGASFKGRLDTVPHKHIEQWCAIELCHTLQRLLQHDKGMLLALVNSSMCERAGIIQIIARAYTQSHVCTLTSLMWRYSSMMAFDFFSTSPSVKAGLERDGGGVGALSRLTEEKKEL